MNYELLQYFIYLMVVLARLIILSILLILSKKLVSIRAVPSTKMFGAVVNSWLNFVSFVCFVVKLQKSKTNPKRTQTNPIFQRPKPILSEIIGILDKFRTTFLCKTNPILLSENLIFYT